MNLLFLSAFICGVMSLPIALQQTHFNHLSLVQMYKRNPLQFVSTMSEVDPQEIGNIIALLKELKEKSEGKETELRNELEAAKDNLGQASNELVDAEDNVRTAVSARESAEGELEKSTAIREDKKAAFNEATRILEDSNDFDDEQKVLGDVIDMLKTLIGGHHDHGNTGWSEYSRDVACEDNGVGRTKECDTENGGGIECCQEKVLEKGFKYVVWWEELCYGTDTCDNPYDLTGTVNYHYDSTDFIKVKTSFLSVNSAPAGRKLLSLESEGLSILKENPKKFIAEMSKADPSAVQSIIEMLEGLKATSEETQREVLQNLDDAEEALGIASLKVIDDENVLQGAMNNEEAAKLELTGAQAAESAAQDAKTEAQDVYDAEIDNLDNEQQVLSDVITALEDLLKRQA